jgi:uncharacterized protein YyaL (SSP411 family)
MAEMMLLPFRDEIVRHGAYYANWAMLLGKMTSPIKEVAILGEDALAIALEIQKSYLPTTLLAGGTTENLPLLRNRLIHNQTAIYVCQDKVCNLPVYSAKEALSLIR